jgi:APA family basic amino acid/polyamine antiporter
MSAPEPAARALGFWTSTALVVGNTIGVGIFVMPASLAPFGLNALSGWLIVVVGCLFLSIVFARLARAFPQDDGPYAYMRRAVGDGASFIILWCYWVSLWVTNAAIAIGVVGYMAVFVPQLGQGHWLPPITALALVWLFVLINLCGLRVMGWMQVLTTALKLLPQAAIMVLGLWQLLVHPSAYVQHLPPNPITLHQTMTASTIALFAMLGIECAMVPAGKVRNPERTIPRATLTGALLVAMIYVSVSAIAVLLVPQTVLSASNAPFADLFQLFLGSGSAKWVTAFVIISGLGALNGWTFMVGEVTQNFARHGNFPAALGKLNRRGAPWPAFLLTGVVATGLLLLNYTDSTAGGFTLLSEAATLDNMPLYIGCALTVLILWWQARSQPLGQAPDRLWITAAFIGSVFVVSVVAGASFQADGLKALLWAIVLGAAGIPIQLWSVYRQRRQRPAFGTPGRAL